MAPPLITVVLPAYDEQGQLKECLDSLLGQSFREFEIIVVQTPSEHCPERLVEAYELRDARVRVLRLDAETGIGRARMAGAAHARGQYLLFLDADHLLPEDAFEAMDARLTETGEVDVLLFGHNREYRGKVWPGNAAELLAAAGPAVFSPAERPELFGAPPLVWDRLMRSGTIPAFPDGFYEEISAVHRSLLAATRVAVLDRECVTIRPGTPCTRRAARAPATSTCSTATRAPSSCWTPSPSRPSRSPPRCARTCSPGWSGTTCSSSTCPGA
ncbi:glycosyltransferase family 2 protein [Kitasatospora fiedleri]|uniref:glycosyltransferase family 2 protein n=1 Tax=Kitasatospora fiedleri TaxID=2991545 RepID=UPI00249CCBCB|nr:glycosyltransferase family A protein [Kitasatospora fiedleri]